MAGEAVEVEARASEVAGRRMPGALRHPRGLASLGFVCFCMICIGSDSMYHLHPHTAR